MQATILSMICSMICLFLAGSASAAQLGISAGGARDFLRIDGEWEELASPLAGIAYDVVLDEEGARGLSFGARYSQDGGLISEYAMDYWHVGGALETFGRIKADVLGKDFLGEIKVLGGVGGGVRFEAVNVPLEVSVHYAIGPDGLRHGGMFFGARVPVGGEE